MNGKVYRDNKYNNKKIRETKKCKKRRLALALGILFIAEGYLISLSVAKAENEPTNNDVHVSPCDHMFCFTCVKKLNNRRCPICRKIIKEIKEHPEFKFGDNDNDSDFDNE